MILLGVNIDHVATLRQARYRNEPNTYGGFVEPDPAAMAWLAEDAGADGITMHVREDRRHVQVEDVQRYLEQKKPVLTSRSPWLRKWWNWPYPFNPIVYAWFLKTAWK